MTHAGRIESFPNSIDLLVWIAMVKSRASLAPVLSQKVVNPFTKERIEVELKAPTTTAHVIVDGIEAGWIYLAMDGSPMLIVTAEEGMEKDVTRIAEEIAATLGARFVADPDPS